MRAYGQGGCPTGNHHFDAPGRATGAHVHLDQAYRSRLSLWLDTVPTDSAAPGDPFRRHRSLTWPSAAGPHRAADRVLPGGTPAWACGSRGVRLEIAGFGASGRNGGQVFGAVPRVAGEAWPGWRARNAADLPCTRRRPCRTPWTRSAGWRWPRASTCHSGQGAVPNTFAGGRRPSWNSAAEHEVGARAREFGFGEPDVRLLGEAEARGIRGGTWCPGRHLHSAHCAAIHPARLGPGAGLQVVRDRGARVFERTPVTEIAPRALRTTHGTVRAEYVIRATEGLHPGAGPGLRRDRAGYF